MLFKERCGILKGAKEKTGITVALAGNPNVGKSTLYNTLTGSHVHTGNWSGKTVGCESASISKGEREIRLVDIPGTYSLFSHSEEERIARDYICFGMADVTAVVCDATALLQNLNLVLQIRETGRRAVAVINFAGDARKRGISIDETRLSRALGMPVVFAEADKRKSTLPLLSLLLSQAETEFPDELELCYPTPVEEAISGIVKVLSNFENPDLSPRWAAIRLLDGDFELREQIVRAFCRDEDEKSRLLGAVATAEEHLFVMGIDKRMLDESVVTAIVSRAEEIYSDAVSENKNKPRDLTVRLDRFLTGRVSAYPAMLLLLALVFFITLSLANYPSELLGRAFIYIEEYLFSLFLKIGMPTVISDVLLCGVLRALGQVVAVMLPPMAIFFPLFALLEDSGYIPRIAYNLDRPFACSGACGKQALTMCMGFGCNAVGIVGARIIDSKRERYLAIVTNSLVPCNGRLPMLVTLISIFYLFFMRSAPSLAVALTLALLIVVGIAATFLVTMLLSRTLLRGKPSAFTIELPPYRRPRFLSVIWRSLTDKCVSVLGRAVTVAAPMGLLIWLLANLRVGEGSILSLTADALLPVARPFGMDGAILLAFILGIPANEIVIPLLVMIYSSGGALAQDSSLLAVRELFILNGWEVRTAVCTAIFALFHWPCSTSLITVYKETKSIKATFLSFIIPTAIGLALCFAVNLIL